MSSEIGRVKHNVGEMIFNVEKEIASLPPPYGDFDTKSIGDLITINQMNEFLEEFKDSSIPRERIDQARDILRRVKLSTLYPQDEDQLGLLGAKIDEYDRIYGEREIKDDAL